MGKGEGRGAPGATGELTHPTHAEARRALRLMVVKAWEGPQPQSAHWREIDTLIKALRGGYRGVMLRSEQELLDRRITCPFFYARHSIRNAVLVGEAAERWRLQKAKASVDLSEVKVELKDIADALARMVGRLSPPNGAGWTNDWFVHPDIIVPRPLSAQFLGPAHPPPALPDIGTKRAEDLNTAALRAGGNLDLARQLILETVDFQRRALATLEGQNVPRAKTDMWGRAFAKEMLRAWQELTGRAINSATEPFVDFVEAAYRSITEAGKLNLDGFIKRGVEEWAAIERGEDGAWQNRRWSYEQPTVPGMEMRRLTAIETEREMAKRFLEEWTDELADELKVEAKDVRKAARGAHRNVPTDELNRLVKHVSREFGVPSAEARRIVALGRVHDAVAKALAARFGRAG